MHESFGNKIQRCRIFGLCSDNYDLRIHLRAMILDIYKSICIYAHTFVGKNDDKISIPDHTLYIFHDGRRIYRRNVYALKLGFKSFYDKSLGCTYDKNSSVHAIKPPLSDPAKNIIDAVPVHP